MVYKFKLASKYQVLEFELEPKETFDQETDNFVDDWESEMPRIKAAIDIINRVGDLVDNPDKQKRTPAGNHSAPSKPPQRKQEELATERQIAALERYGIDGTGMTKSQAWKTLSEMKND